MVEGYQPYEYQPLPDNDYIRRLILEPGTGDDALIGRLEVIELADANELHPFEAISYAWGKKGRDQTIITDGKRMFITANLRDALRQSRYPDRCRALWADSICIDQKNEQEKGHQVGLMGRIYKTSSCTLVCLGLNAKDQKDARAIASLIADVEAMMDRVFDNPEFSWEWDAFPFPQEDNPLLTDDRWESWEQLVRCPWFRRGWVVQEAALGPEGLMLWAGVQIRWMRVLRVFHWLDGRAKHLMPTLTYWAISPILSQTYALQCSKEAKTFLPEYSAMRIEAMPLLGTLQSARLLDVSDRKDRIYAFMALPTSDGAMPALQPDYRDNTSHLDVYREFAIKYLDKNSNLDLLTFVEHKGEDDEAEETEETGSFPSWVPRWDHGRDVVGWFDPNHRKMHSDASEFTLLHGNGILQVKAIVFDAVKYVSETIKHTPPASQAVEQVVSLWRHVAPHSNKYPGPHQDHLALAFLDAICRGRYDGDWEEWWQSQKAFAQLLQADRPDCPMDIYTANRNTQRLSIYLADRSRNRRFILLGRGYQGLASEATHEGDVCAIIFGTRLPLILREVAGKDGHYTVVGAAYIQSKVHEDDGMPWRLGQYEDCEDWTEWDLPIQDILLC